MYRVSFPSISAKKGDKAFHVIINQSHVSTKRHVRGGEGGRGGKDTFGLALEAAERARRRADGVEGQEGAAHAAEEEIARLPERHGCRLLRCSVARFTLSRSAAAPRWSRTAKSTAVCRMALIRVLVGPGWPNGPA